MIRKQSDIALITLSVRVYQALLVAYPKKFQQEYGSHMVQVFRDCCLRTVRQGGTNGMARLWVITLIDIVQSVVSEHAQKEIEMKKEMKPEDIRMAGWALIWGAVAFVLGVYAGILGEIQPILWVVSILLLILVSLPLLIVGILAVRNRYSEKVGSFGKNILLVGAILGPIASVIGLLTMVVDPDFWTNWINPWTGHAILFACLTLFGVVALQKQPLPRGNVLPIIAGLWYPIALYTPDVFGNVSGDLMSIATFAFFAVQGVALAALGYILKSDAPQEMTAA